MAEEKTVRCYDAAKEQWIREAKEIVLMDISAINMKLAEWNALYNNVSIWDYYQDQRGGSCNG
jgi:hypothetical protein